MIRTSWEGWAVVLGNGRLRCAFPKHERLSAVNEASRYENAKVVLVRLRKLTTVKVRRRPAKTARKS